MINKRPTTLPEREKRRLAREAERDRKLAEKQIAALQIVGEINKLDLQPNDILILTTQWGLTKSQVDELRERLGAALAQMGCTNKFIILTSGLRMEVLRPEKPEAAAN